MCAPRRLSGTARRPRPRPASPTALARPPPLRPGKGGLATTVPARDAVVVVWPRAALRGWGSGRDHRGVGARSGHAPAHSPVTAGRPASQAGPLLPIATLRLIPPLRVSGGGGGGGSSGGNAFASQARAARAARSPAPSPSAFAYRPPTL